MLEQLKNYLAQLEAPIYKYTKKYLARATEKHLNPELKKSLDDVAAKAKQKKPKQRGVYRLGLKATGDPKSNQQPSIADAFKLARDKHEIAKLEKELAEKK